MLSYTVAYTYCVSEGNFLPGDLTQNVCKCPVTSTRNGGYGQQMCVFRHTGTPYIEVVMPWNHGKHSWFKLPAALKLKDLSQFAPKKRARNTCMVTFATEKRPRDMQDFSKSREECRCINWNMP
eukprot:2575645-Amphidinium_carterae.1